MPASDQAGQHQHHGHRGPGEDRGGVRRAFGAGHSDAPGLLAPRASRIDEAVRDRWKQGDPGGSLVDGARGRGGVPSQRGVHGGYCADQGLGQDPRHRHAHHGVPPQSGEPLHGEDEGLARRAERGGPSLPQLPVLVQSAGGEVDASGRGGAGEPRAAGALPRDLHLGSRGGRALQVHRAADPQRNQPHQRRNHRFGRVSLREEGRGR